MVFDFGFDWELYWRWNEQAVGQDALHYVSILVSLAVGGAVFGSAQALAIRSRSVRARSWIVATVAGFGVLAVIVEWPLIASGVLGIIPGPVEPIILTVGGGSFAGISQYLLLRGEGIAAGKWLGRWIAGLFGGLVATALFFSLVEGPLDTEVSWPLAVFLSGFIVAGVAALASGKALFTALPERP
jgi:hypothetical protein